MTKEEIKVILALIDDYQFDGGEWIIDGVDLSKLKKKLKKRLKTR